MARFSFKKFFRKPLKSVVNVAHIMATGGISGVHQAAREGHLGTTAQARVREQEKKLEHKAKKATLESKKMAQAAGKMAISIPKAVATGKALYDPIGAGKDIAKPAIDQTKEGISMAMSEFAKMTAPENQSVLDAPPPELKESAADRAERERREFLQKKRAGERAGRGTGRTILTQRTGQTPSLLGGL